MSKKKKAQKINKLKMQDYDFEKLLADEAEKLYNGETKRNKKSLYKNRKTKDIKLNGIDIQAVPSDTTKFDQRPLMEENIIPSHPSSTILVAPSGGGKTTLFANMLLNIDMWRDYFSRIIVFSRTAKTDGLYRQLESQIKEEDLICDDLEKELEKIVKDRTAECEDNDIENTDPILIVFEDLTSEKDLMKNKSFIKLWVQNRHMNVSTICMVHKYRALSRIARLQANNVIAFACCVSDVEQMAEDLTVGNLNKKQMMDIISFCFEKNDNNKHPFFYANMKAPHEIRFRKCFKHRLRLNI